MTADGSSKPHADGQGWDVDVDVEVPLLGKICGYQGAVRVT